MEDVKLGCKLLADIKSVATTATNHIRQLCINVQGEQMTTSKVSITIALKNFKNYEELNSQLVTILNSDIITV